MNLHLRKTPRHILVTFSGFSSRAVVATCQLIIIRLIVKDLGAEQYAIFAVLYAMATWFQLADFGIGASVQNFISERRTKRQVYGGLIQLSVLSAFLILLLECSLAFAGSSWAGSWLLRQFALVHSEQQLLFLLVGTLALTAGVGQVAYKIWFGEHKGYLSNLVPAVSQVIGTVLAYFTISRHLQPPIEWAIGAYLLPAAISAIAALGYLLYRARGPRIEFGASTPLFVRASGFGPLAIGSVLALQVDLVAVSQFLPPHEIATYAVVAKMFAFIFNVYLSALAAIWPVCAEYVQREEWKRIWRLLARYGLLGGCIIASFTLALGWKTRVILNILAPNADLNASRVLVFLFGAYYLLRVWTDSFTTVVMSMSDLRTLWATVPLQAGLAVALQWYLVPRYHLDGAVAGSMLSFLMTIAWVYPRSVFRRARRKGTLQHVQVAQ